jgi:hypothetical protein
MGILSTILISGIGTAIGTYFTNKSWDHKEKVEMKQNELKNANELFESLSSDMDERLFNMGWVFPGIKSESVPEKEVEEWWEIYQKILVEWNGKLNRRIAKIERYFGKKLSDIFDFKIQEKFCELNEMLDEYYREVEQRKDFDRVKFREMAEDLYKLIRQFNLDVIRSIQKGQVGIFHPDVN